MPNAALALCMIIKNEEKNLPRFIENHRQFFDEWVIADTGSSDRSLTLLEQAGIPFHTIPWTDDFAAARNRALSLCRAPWVIALDADEWISKQNQVALRAALPHLTADAVHFDILNYADETRFEEAGSCALLEYTPPDGTYLQNFGGHQDFGYRRTSLPRLFRRQSGYFWKSAIHEVLTPPAHSKSPPKEQHVTDVVIHHFGFLSPSISDQKKELYHRIARSLEEEAIQTADAKLLFEAGRIHPDKVQRERLLLQAEPLLLRDSAYWKVRIQSLWQEERLQEALEATQTLINLNSEILDGYLAQALILSKTEGALSAFKRLKQSFSRFRKNPLFHYHCAKMASLANLAEEALSHSKQAASLAPNCRTFSQLHQQIELCLK